MTRLVFVYGSLMRGEANHHEIAAARYAGKARTAARYRLVDLGQYPAMLEDGNTAISGEIYEVDDAHLAALDDFEGHPELYVRRAIRLDDGRAAEAYFLAGDAPAAPELASGKWR